MNHLQMVKDSKMERTLFYLFFIFFGGQHGLITEKVGVQLSQALREVLCCLTEVSQHIKTGLAFHSSHLAIM